MDLRKLRAFVVVAEELNFRKSAEILGMTQPPLSRLISSLEDELSTQLFDRTTRTVRLTGAGVFLLKEGRELLTRSEDLKKELRTIAKRKSGTLNIGFSITAFLAVLPNIIEEFRDRFPKVKIDLHQDSRQGILDGLNHARFDACFLEGQVKEDVFKRNWVQDEVMGVLLPKNHHLSKKTEIELRDLKDEVLILHDGCEHHASFDMIHRLCKQSGFKPKIYLKKENESCPVLVAIGKGVSLTIASSQNFVPGETCFVPIKNLYLPVSVFWSLENPNPTLKSFLSFVIESKSLKPRNMVSSLE